MPAVRQRKRDIVEIFRTGHTHRLTSTSGLDLLMGEACFTGPRTVRVDLDDGQSRELTGRKVFINTGGRPSSPPIEGLGEVPALDSESVMELDRVPEHLLVLGGGYVGLEFGQMFRRFGSQVTIIQRGPKLLSQEDPDIAEAVAEVMRQDGIEVLVNASAEGVRGNGSGIELRLDGQTSRTVSGSHLLVAVGRRPNTDMLNLPAAGVDTDTRGFVKVNERLETSAPDVYAMGDVNGGPAFTHISYDDFRILRTNLLEGGSATTTGRLVPYTVFIDPQLGRVGMTEAEARESGRAIKVARMPMSSVARALEAAEPRGLIKALVDAETEEILGAAVLGMEGGEIMNMFEIAMLGNLRYTVLKEAIFAHPTLGELLNSRRRLPHHRPRVTGPRSGGAGRRSAARAAGRGHRAPA
jgi:pyruvate/2-oxoglutarate dehydrogenase complex dihydrolipoamide dehydrogenase (E3) component